MIASSLETESKESPKRSIRFSTSLEKEITNSVPHLSGNFSAQVKHLVRLGLGEDRTIVDTIALQEDIKGILKFQASLGRVGNNLNQIAYHLNSGDKPDMRELSASFLSLKTELHETQKSILDLAGKINATL